jgi:hypothetical protein
MTREPASRDRRYRTSVGAPVDLTAAVEAPVEPYPLRRGGNAAPDRSQPPDIGAACHDTRKVSPAPGFTDELRSGVELGTTRGNNEAVPKTAQEFGDARREARGVGTRPVRPGRANYG